LATVPLVGTGADLLLNLVRPSKPTRNPSAFAAKQVFALQIGATANDVKVILNLQCVSSSDLSCAMSAKQYSLGKDVSPVTITVSSRRGWRLTKNETGSFATVKVRAGVYEHAVALPIH
jgi:hypothetical protein